jgi:hypothetical protein
LGGIDFYVNELTPGLFVPGKALHEASVAVAAIMLASHIRVEGVGIDLRFGKNGFRLNFSDDHEVIIGAIGVLQWEKNQGMGKSIIIIAG